MPSKPSAGRPAISTIPTLDMTTYGVAGEVQLSSRERVSAPLFRLPNASGVRSPK
jgi:hypothetical protein